MASNVKYERHMPTEFKYIEALPFFSDKETVNLFLDYFKERLLPAEDFFMGYKCAMMQVETRFKSLNEQFSLDERRNPIETIKSRLKSPESIIRKACQKDLDKSLEAVAVNIFDIAGVRVICSFEQDIYRLADCFLSQEDIKLLEKKDYITHPKDNGYRSLHLIVSIPVYMAYGRRDVTVEVQLRTMAMDFWASLEHKLRYKQRLSEDEMKLIEEELYECASISASLDRRMQEVANQLNHTGSTRYINV